MGFPTLALPFRNYDYVQAAGNPRVLLPPISEEGSMIRISAVKKGVRLLPLNEQSRIHSAQEGDREAFDALLAANRAEIRRFVAKRVPKDQVEDMLQDIMLAAWTSITEFDSRSRFRTWLYGIAINKCKSHYRTQQRRVVPVSLADVVTERQAPGPVVSQLEARISSIMELLSDNHRQLLDLYYYGELTLPEIARLLDRNLNTVKYQFYRAHTELANLMKEGDAE